MNNSALRVLAGPLLRRCNGAAREFSAPGKKRGGPPSQSCCCNRELRSIGSAPKSAELPWCALPRPIPRGHHHRLDFLPAWEVSDRSSPSLEENLACDDALLEWAE